MTLQSKLDQELTNLGNGAAATVTIEELPRELTCVITERNSLAVSFNDLRLTTGELASAAPADLERIGKQLADRLTYLMEPISPIEPLGSTSRMPRTAASAVMPPPMMR